EHDEQHHQDRPPPAAPLLALAPGVSRPVVAAPRAAGTGGGAPRRPVLNRRQSPCRPLTPRGALLGVARPVELLDLVGAASGGAPEHPCPIGVAPTRPASSSVRPVNHDSGRPSVRSPRL